MCALIDCDQGQGQHEGLCRGQHELQNLRPHLMAA